jgi:hypothetical protein
MTRLHKTTTQHPKTARGDCTLTCWCDWTWTGHRSDLDRARESHEQTAANARRLAKFLRARLDETDAIATAAKQDSTIGGEHQPWRLGGGDDDLYAGHACLATGPWGRLRDRIGAHLVHHDPYRVLRQTQAVRDLLDEFESHIRAVYSGDYPQEYAPIDDILQPFVEAAAFAYADHADWDDAWEPATT